MAANAEFQNGGLPVLGAGLLVAEMWPKKRAIMT
jgi:hypothetical protein